METPSALKKVLSLPSLALVQIYGTELSPSSRETPTPSLREIRNYQGLHASVGMLLPFTRQSCAGE